MKSVFSSDKGKAEDSRALVPSEFRDTAAQFLRTLKGGLDANEVRALAANKVASPLLQVSFHSYPSLRSTELQVVSAGPGDRGRSWWRVIP
jgi:hypothetical protein